MKRVRSGTSQTESASRPPLASTRANSAAATSGRGRWLRTNAPTTASNEESAKGSASASPRPEVELRVIAPRHGQHSLGDVHAHGLGPARGRRGGDVPRAGGDIEHPHARPDAGGIQERIDEARGDRAGHAAVRVRPPRPPGRLERLELLGPARHRP